jgi:hypothetical protein
MNTMKKGIAAVAAVILSLGFAVAISSPASAAEVDHTGQCVVDVIHHPEVQEVDQSRYSQTTIIYTIEHKQVKYTGDNSAVLTWLNANGTEGPDNVWTLSDAVVNAAGVNPLAPGIFYNGPFSSSHVVDIHAYGYSGHQSLQYTITGVDISTTPPSGSFVKSSSPVTIYYVHGGSPTATLGDSNWTTDVPDGWTLVDTRVQTAHQDAYDENVYGTCPAIPCAVTGTPYTEDGFPAFTADGQDYEGGAGHALNWLVPTSGNLQGFTGATVTIASATGYHVAYRFVLYANGTSGYTSVSAEPYLNGWAPGQTGVFTITPATLVWNSHIATGPGSQSQPVSITDMAALIPQNQFISQGIHYGSSEPEGASTVVSHVSGCITFDKPVQPDPIPSITTEKGDVQCSTEGGGSYVITTHHFLTYPAFVDGAWTFDGQEPTPSGDDTYQTVEVGTDECPAFVTPEAPTSHDECGVSKDTLTLPGVVDGNESETANAHYTVVENTGTSITVIADPLDGFQFNAPGDDDTYTLSEGSAVWHFTFNNDACPLPPVTLATTGVSIVGGVSLALVLLALGALVIYLRRQATQQ